MKKQNLLKLAFTMLAMVIMTGVMAQIPVQYTATETETMVQTEGISFRLYVAPDVVYSPNYGDGTLGAKSLWTFTYTGLTSTLVSGTGYNQNWVEFTAPVASATDYSVGVVESNSDFSCVDAGRTTLISIIEAPTAALATNVALPTGWTAGAAAKEFFLCAAAGDLIAVPQLDITFTEDTRRVANAYDYTLSVTRGGYDINGNVLIADAPVTTGFDKTTMQAIAGYAASPIAHTTSGTMQILVDGTQSVRTKYVFTLTNISSKTSYLSYFRANTGFTPTIVDNYYAVAGQEVTFWLNPAPVTGPIYHIPNNYTF